MFVMIDGIEGGGKSTIVEAWKQYLEEQNFSVFDLKKYLLENNRYPNYEEIRPYNFILSAEPTYTGIGKVIREELIKNGTSYADEAIAQAYSLDRLILYTKIILPALKDNKHIIQDRGVSTSLCYQSLNGNLSLDWLSTLPGNALALEHRPDYLCIIEMSPETAQQRLATRYEKQDDVIFDKLDFQQKAMSTYLSTEYQKLFQNRGTKIELLNTDLAIDIMKQESIEFLKSTLSL